MTTIKNSSMVVDQTVKKIFINNEVMRIDVYTITPPEKMYNVRIDGDNIDYLNHHLVAEGKSALLTLKSSPRHTITNYSVFGATVGESYIYDYDQALNVPVENVNDDITILVETKDLPYYPVNFELFGATADSNNPTELAASARPIKFYFNVIDENYKFSDSIYVNGASYSWNPELGELTLWSATDPVSVSIVTATDRWLVPITVSTSSCYADENNPTEVWSDESDIVLKFIPIDGYKLSDTAAVTGASYSWNQETGELILHKIDGTYVDVFVPAYEEIKSVEIKTSLISCAADPNNPTEILSINQNVVLKFTAASNYKLPSSINVSGADYTWNSTTGELTLIKTFGTIVNISIIATAVGQTYRITQTLIGCTADSSNPTTIAKGERITLKFTPTSGSFSSSINVSGAQYIWDYANGELTLYNAQGNVNIFIFAF